MPSDSTAPVEDGARSPDGPPRPTAGASDRTERWRRVRALLTPKLLYMGMLGFSSGLPFLMAFNTLSFRLAEAGIDVVLIGFFVWFGLVNNLKFFWAPVLDRVSLPGLGPLRGRRGGWVVACQVGIALALAGQAFADPAVGLAMVAMCSLLTVFWSATQDVAIDAWRIEMAESEAEMGLLTAAHLWGYRAGLVAAGGGTLFLAGTFDWTAAFLVMAAVMLAMAAAILVLPAPPGTRLVEPGRRIPGALAVGLPVLLVLVAGVSALLVGIGSGLPLLAEAAGLTPERDTVARNVLFVAALPFIAAGLLIPWVRRSGAGSRLATSPATAPFFEFLTFFGWHTLLVLVFVSLYRIGDFVMAALSKALYADAGYGAQAVGVVEGAFGLVATIVGVAVGGISIARLGLTRALLLGGTIAVAGNVAFAWLAAEPPALWRLAAAVGLDNFGGGFAATAFIVFLSRLTSRDHAGTQYALLSSFAFMVPQLIAGGSGLLKAEIGYVWFFLATAGLALPGLALIPFVAGLRRPGTGATAR